RSGLRLVRRDEQRLAVQRREVRRVRRLHHASCVRAFRLRRARRGHVIGADHKLRLRHARHFRRLRIEIHDMIAADDREHARRRRDQRLRAAIQFPVDVDIANAVPPFARSGGKNRGHEDESEAHRGGSFSFCGWDAAVPNEVSLLKFICEDGMLRSAQRLYLETGNRIPARRSRRCAAPVKSSGSTTLRALVSSRWKAAKTCSYTSRRFSRKASARFLKEQRSSSTS